MDKVAAFISKLLGGGISNVADAVNQFVFTKQEKAELDKQLKEMSARHDEFTEEQRLKMLQAVLTDVADARDLYKHDSWLQKMYGMGIPIIYISLIALTICIYTKQMEAPEFIKAIITGAIGALSAKMSTITDFLFGSSKTEREANGK